MGPVSHPAHTSGPVLRTERLILRPWRPDDLDPFAALNADPVVMEHFPRPLTRADSAAFIDRITTEWTAHGYGLWAVEVPGVAPFIGFTGLHGAVFEAPFTPAVEVGWRLAAEYWGRGYASEAARAALGFGFATVGLAEILSFTAVTNTRSQRVMERIGMARDVAGDFDHPAVPEGHPIRPHVLYRIQAPSSSNRSRSTTG